MKFKTLGSSDLRVSEVCLGTMTFGNQCSEVESHEILDAFVAQGGNFIDTAEMYPVPVNKKYAGRSEEFIGTWLEKHPEQREKVILATKMMGPSSCDYIVDNRGKSGTGSPKLVPSQMRDALEASLNRLKTDYVDLYQLHWPERYNPRFGGRQYLKSKEFKYDAKLLFDDMVVLIGELIKEGKIKAWGLSNESTFGVCQWCEACKRHGVPFPATIQNDFSLADRKFEQDLAEACSDINYNISLIAYGCLNGGLLSGKYNKTPAKGVPAVVPKFSRHDQYPEFQGRYHGKKARELSEALSVVAEKHGLTPVELNLGWAYSRFFMGAVIIGCTTVEQLNADIAAADVKISDELSKEIDDVCCEHAYANAME